MKSKAQLLTANLEDKKYWASATLSFVIMTTCLTNAGAATVVTHKYAGTADNALFAARSYSNSGKWKQAEDCYRKFLAKQPSNVDAHRELAQILSYQPDKRQEAIREFDTVLKFHPDDQVAKFERAMTLAWIGSYSKSVDEIRHLALQHPKLELDVDDDGRKKLPVKLALAQVLNWSGATADAERAYADYLKDAPSDRGARFELALLLRNQDGTRKEALACFDQILRARPDDKQAQFAKAMTLAWMRQYDKALPLLQSLVQQNAKLTLDNLPVKQALAQVLSWSGNFAQSIQAYKTYLAEAPNDNAARLELADALNAAGLMADAENAYKEYLKKQPGDAHALRSLAEILSYQPCSRQEALTIFADILQKNPKDATVRLDLAKTLLWMGDRQRADAELATLQNAVSDDPETHKQLAIACLSLDKADQSLQEFRAAVAHGANEHDPEIIDGIGQSLIRLGNAGAAQSNYQAGLSLFPQESKFQIGLAESLALEGKTKLALCEFNLALPLNTNAENISELIGFLSEKQELRPLSVALCRQILKSQPDSITALRTLGELLSWSDTTRDEGITYLRKCLSLSPEDLEAKESLADALSWDKQRKESLQLYREELASKPNNVNLIAKYTEALSWSGKLDEAKKNYKQILSQDPKNRAALIGLGECLTWSADNLQAEDVFKKAAALYPGDPEIILDRARNLKDLGRVDLAKQLLHQYPGIKWASPISPPYNY